MQCSILREGVSGRRNSSESGKLEGRDSSESDFSGFPFLRPGFCVFQLGKGVLGFLLEQGVSKIVRGSSESEDPDELDNGPFPIGSGFSPFSFPLLGKEEISFPFLEQKGWSDRSKFITLFVGGTQMKGSGVFAFSFFLPFPLLNIIFV